MSGEHYNKAEWNLENIADIIEDDIRTNKDVDEFGESRAYSVKTIAKMAELEKELRILRKKLEVAALLYSGDIGEVEFHKRIENVS